MENILEFVCIQAMIVCFWGIYYVFGKSYLISISDLKKRNDMSSELIFIIHLLWFGIIWTIVMAVMLVFIEGIYLFTGIYLLNWLLITPSSFCFMTYVIHNFIHYTFDYNIVIDIDDDLASLFKQYGIRCNLINWLSILALANYQEDFYY